MAGASLLTLLDDIAAVLDDVAAMTKLSTQKTAGVLTDDLAVNAEQVAGVRAQREIPVIASVAKGSFLNKLIIIPAILLINNFVPWLMIILLLIGGAFLCYEGAHKIAHIFDKKSNAANKAEIEEKVYTEEELRGVEKTKIRGAIRTDFILSAEIMVIALSVMAASTLTIQIATLITLAIIITVGVYGIVAGIVKLDDLGFYLIRKSPSKKSILNTIGRGLVNTAPYLMKALGFIGTVAMFLVGGGIVIAEIPYLIALQTSLTNLVSISFIQALMPTIASFVVGIVVGFAVLPIVTVVSKLRNREKATA